MREQRQTIRKTKLLQGCARESLMKSRQAGATGKLGRVDGMVFCCFDDINQMKTLIVCLGGWILKGRVA